MAVKVFLSSVCNHEVIGNLVKSDNWEPCYWIIPFKIQEKVKEVFPDVTMHDTYEAELCIPSSELRSLELKPLDQPLLKELVYHESIVLKMMDRMDPYNVFGYKERLEFYYKHLRYWSAVLEKFKPEIVLFNIVPHQISNYVIYILSCQKGLRTAFSCITGFVYLNAHLHKIEDELPAVALYKKTLAKDGICTVLLSAKMQKYIDKARQSCYEDALPARILMVKHTVKKNDIINRSLVRSIYECLCDFRTILASILKPPREHFVKRKGKKLTDPFWSRFEFSLYKYKFKRKKLSFARYYERIAEVPDLKCKYVYVALAKQPELSTCPQGDFYVDQRLMIEVLSKSVPEGWNIYVKENILQFNEKFAGECSRSYEYYDTIASLANVKLVSLRTHSSFDLIDNAESVASVTGTTGFEAVLRGIPAITFGRAWYNGCEGVYHVSSYEECRKVIKEIEKDCVVNYEKVRMFLSALEESCFNYCILDKELQYADISYEENVKNLTKSIQEACKGV